MHATDRQRHSPRGGRQPCDGGPGAERASGRAGQDHPGGAGGHRAASAMCATWRRPTSPASATTGWPSCCPTPTASSPRTLLDALDEADRLSVSARTDVLLRRFPAEDPHALAHLLAEPAGGGRGRRGGDGARDADPARCDPGFEKQGVGGRGAGVRPAQHRARSLRRNRQPRGGADGGGADGAVPGAGPVAA